MTQTQIENSFASNICRCTGYRPIADAFKTFAENVDKDLNQKLIDLEDLSALKSCKKQCLKTCNHQTESLREGNITDDQNWCVIEKSDKTMIIVDSGKRKWYKVFTLDDVFKIIAKSDDYKLIAGNTGQGIKKPFRINKFCLTFMFFNKHSFSIIVLLFHKDLLRCGFF